MHTPAGDGSRWQELLQPSHVLLFEGPVTVLAKSAEKRTERLLFLLDDRLVTVDGGTRTDTFWHAHVCGIHAWTSTLRRSPTLTDAGATKKTIRQVHLASSLSAADAGA